MTPDIMRQYPAVHAPELEDDLRRERDPTTVQLHL